MNLNVRWLGNAGLELSYGDTTLLVDPFLTRPPLWALLTGRRLRSNQAVVARYIPRADFVLVSHPHYDHLMDVAEVLRRTGALAYGSPNTSALLLGEGIASQDIRLIHTGERLTLGPFIVDIFPKSHTRTPLDRWLNGPLPENLRPPYRMFDYRMDACYGFSIEVGEHKLLVGSYPIQTDTLFISPYRSVEQWQSLLNETRPARVVPIHWDDFFRPLSRPLLPMWVTPSQGWAGFPPVRRLDLSAISRIVKSIRPQTEIVIPEFNQPFVI